MWLWIFIGWLTLGVIANAIMYADRHTSENSTERKKVNWAFWIVFTVAMIMILCLVGYIVGWIWYYLCGGFLAIMESVWWMKIAYGLFTIIPAGFIIGLIAIIFGWDPWK